MTSPTKRSNPKQRVKPRKAAVPKREDEGNADTSSVVDFTDRIGIEKPWLDPTHPANIARRAPVKGAQPPPAAIATQRQPSAADIQRLVAQNEEILHVLNTVMTSGQQLVQHITARGHDETPRKENTMKPRARKIRRASKGPGPVR